MKKWILNNIGLKLTAIFLAIITWIYVRGELTSQENTETRVFSGVEIKVLGSVSPMKERQWRVRLEPEKIDLTVTGPGSILNKVHSDNILVFVDLSNLKMGEENRLPLKVSLPEGLSVELDVNACKVRLF